jgi:hypothetical protein
MYYTMSQGGRRPAIWDKPVSQTGPRRGLHYRSLYQTSRALSREMGSDTSPDLLWTDRAPNCRPPRGRQLIADNISGLIT